MTASHTCEICELVALEPAGGWYFDNEYWAVGPHFMSAVPGWTVVYLRRHVERLPDLTTPELESMGATVSRAAAEIERVTQAERVYFASFGERFAHVHIVLMPRGADVPTEHWSSGLHFHQALYADAPAARELEERLRAAMNARH